MFYEVYHRPFTNLETTVGSTKSRLIRSLLEIKCGCLEEYELLVRVQGNQSAPTVGEVDVGKVVRHDDIIGTMRSHLRYRAKRWGEREM